MKLVEIQIDRCGIWRDLALPLENDGLSVLYGPNGTGKSTLVQFICGVLYGFTPDVHRVAGEPGRKVSAAGSLVLDGHSSRWRIHRSAVGNMRGTACLVGDNSAQPAHEFLTETLRGLDEQAFRSAFTVDLPQLRELEAASPDEATSRIYDVALGPDGQRLLAAGRRAEGRRNKLVDPLQKDGELVRLLERHDQLKAELREILRVGELHAQRCREKARLEADADDQRERKAGIREQLRGHEFLERSWRPWQHARECRDELKDLPPIADFPERGVERLDQIESELAAAAESRDRVLAEAKKHREQIRRQSAESTRIRFAGTMQAFVEQRAWLADLSERREAATRELETIEQACQAELERLGPEWSPDRIEALRLSPGGWQRLSGTAQSLNGTLARRQALRRRRRQLSARCRELKDSLAECLSDLGGQSVDTALIEARERLRQMNHLAKLRIREAELNQRQFSLVEHRERVAPQLALPRWVHIVLGIFGFMGIILAGWGLIAGVVTSGIAGAIYVMLGITCAGLAVGLKTQYEGDARRRIDEADAQLAATLAELNDIRASMARMAEMPTGEAGTTAAPTPIDGGELVRRATERVAELVELAQHQRNWRSMRRRLDETKQKLEVARREVDTARQSWRALLEELSLPDSTAAAGALQTWQQLLNASHHLDQLRQARETFRTVDAVWSASRQRIAEFGRRLEAWDVDYDRPIDVLDAWEKQLAGYSRVRNVQRELKSQIRMLRREASKHQTRVGELKVQRDALLVQGGAATRDEFEERARQLIRRKCLEEQLEAAELELEAVGSEYTDLALVEDDLLAYDPAENGRCLETLRHESADLERDLQRTNESLAALQREILALENDRSASRLRLEIEQVREELKLAARQWAIVELAAQAGDGLRRDFERTHQPAVLVAASRFLARLTQGRYPAVWTPLGERRLMVDDERGRSLPVGLLSRGAREQLFLAVRLAVVEDLAHKGVALPLIMDDVFVNYDDTRLEAAADVLCEFAHSGHQVLLLTCHLHLARLFQGKGIEPIWLPDRRPERETRDEQRRAG